MPNYTPVRIGPNPPQGLPPAATLTGTEMVPMDQPTGAQPPWLTCKASLATIAGYVATSGSIVGTANEIAVSTVAGVATISVTSPFITPGNEVVSGALQVTNTSATGFLPVAGAEIQLASGAAYFEAFNRGTSLYIPVHLAGSTISFDIIGTTYGSADANGHWNFAVPAAAGSTVTAVSFGAQSAAFRAGIGVSNAGSAAFYNSDVLNASLVMNSGGADYGTVGNTGTQTWGLGSAQSVGFVGASALQWNNGGGFGATTTTAIGPGTFTSSGSVYQLATRATLMMNGGTSGDSLIDFSINGTTGGFIQYNPGVYVRHYTNSVPIAFWPGAPSNPAGSVTGAGQIISGSWPGFITDTSSRTTYQRGRTDGGYLDGNYPNVETGSTPGCIYTIGGNTSGTSYYPSTTSLNTMYGVGYCLGNVTGIQAMGQPADWGFYIAAGGVGNTFIDASTGSIWTEGAAVLNNAGNATYFVGSGITKGGVGGKITAQSGGTASGGNAGDIILIY